MESIRLSALSNMADGPVLGRKQSGASSGNPRVAFSSSTLDPVAPRSYNVGWRVQRGVALWGKLTGGIREKCPTVDVTLA